MATIKSYTDLEQSRKLAEILPLKSADMYWIHVGDGGDRDFWKVETIQLSWRPYKGIKDNYIPAWSLAALMKILHCTKEDIVSLSYGGYKNVEYILNWCLDYEFEDGDYKKTFSDNPIDACVSMIEKLHELNLL